MCNCTDTTTSANTHTKPTAQSLTGIFINLTYRQGCIQDKAGGGGDSG